MKKKILILLIAFSAMFLTTQPVQATQEAGNSAVLKNNFTTIDARKEKLQKFLESYDSPLTPYADNFIKAADECQIDWKLVPAITGVESSFGKQIPIGSYNAYGWANGVYYFQSWEQSIGYVCQYLKEKYIDRGLDDPYKIGPVYAPPSPAWAGKVTYFMKLIDCFGDETCLENLILTL